VNHADCGPAESCALHHAFDVATVETIQRNNDSVKNNLAKMKSSLTSLKTGWLLWFPTWPTKPEAYYWASLWIKYWGLGKRDFDGL